MQSSYEVPRRWWHWMNFKFADFTHAVPCLCSKLFPAPGASCLPLSSPLSNSLPCTWGEWQHPNWPKHWEHASLWSAQLWDHVKQPGALQRQQAPANSPAIHKSLARQIDEKMKFFLSISRDDEILLVVGPNYYVTSSFHWKVIVIYYHRESAKLLGL